jgi:hypothetical protein
VLSVDAMLMGRISGFVADMKVRQDVRALFAELSGLFDAGELHIRKAPGCSGAPSSLL